MSHDPHTGEILADSPISNESAPVVKRGIVRTTFAAFFDKLIEKGQRPDGSEMPDPTPMQPPLGYKRQPTMVEHIRELVRSEHLRLAAESAELETFEEAEDFDVDDDYEPISAYEFERIFEPLVAAEPAPAAPREPIPPADGPNASPDSAIAPIASSPA